VKGWSADGALGCGKIVTSYFRLLAVRIRGSQLNSHVLRIKIPFSQFMPDDHPLTKKPADMQN